MKVLAVRTHAFGDALMCTPAVSALAGIHRVDVLTGPSAQPVWNRLPGVGRTVTAPVPGGLLRMFLWTAGRRLRGYDKVYYLGFSRAMRRWSRLLTGSPVISGGDTPLGSWETVRGFSPTPAALAYAGIAGVEPDSLKPVFPVSPGETAEALRQTGGGPYAVVSPGGGRNPRQSVDEKRWPAGRWREISRFLRDRGMRVVAVGGAADREAADMTGCDLNLAGSCSWGVTAGVIAASLLFAGNDTGPAHLAVACGVRGVVLFGPTDPDALYPPGSVIAVRSPESCSPCYSNGIFKGCRRRGGCMASIEEGRVLAALEGIVS
jgi:ADP-heptose:LPS heptosyltransferase